MRTLTFPRGGIHPPDRKKTTRSLPTRNAIIPRTSIVPLLQHTGAPARAQVGPGERVHEGMLIGRAQSSDGAHVHAPTPGVVREIREIELPDGRRSLAVVIDMDGAFDRLGKEIPAQQWDSLSAEQIRGLLREHGVVSMGDAPVPLHRAILTGEQQCETLLLNGCESEPYLSADHRLMVERAEAVIAGARIVARAVAAREIVVAVEANMPDALAAMQRQSRRARRADGASLRCVRLKVKYPQGNDRQLVKAVTGREVPTGGGPADAGVVTVDVATAKAVHDAVVLREPVVERVLTVSGGAVAEPANIKARVGTPLVDLLRECGGLVGVPAKIVVGGPLAGYAVTDLSTPVTKSTRGVIALTDREVHAAPRTACIRCARCVDSCPMGLDPSRLFKLIEHEEHYQAVEEGLFDCTECGACGYICPSRIPLVEGMRSGKERVREQSGE